jgi:hypothetical protein
MRRTLIFETVDERNARLRREALRALDEAAAGDDALDAMVKRSIKLHGP